MAPPRKLKAVVASFTEHVEGLYSVELAPQAAPPGFRPGQFLHLALDPYDPSGPWPASRVFSIASAPGAPRLRVTFAVKGGFTTRLARELAPGREVWVKLPFGSFQVIARPGIETVLVAGGTGVTPYVALLEGMAARSAVEPVWLFYGARSRRHLVYEPLVAACRRQVPGFRGRLFVEEGDADADAGIEPGSLALPRILAEVSRPTVAHYYLSGPPAMIVSFREQLVARGIPGEQVSTDDWD